jgi:2-polyprenyl-6-methoxyphenol hydroxylase-like FAD-dependent oxidoreductase
LSNVSVLIIGAGPTGLMMAYQLARFGISFRIVDKKSEPTQRSNAVALQTRTLEIFKQIGLADDFLRVGQPCHALCFLDQGKEYARASFANLESVYQFILSMPQATTEKILNQALANFHCEVEWSREMIDVTVNLADIEVTVRHHDGVEEFIRCEYLLGCDGAHSVVREECEFQFPGEDLSEQFVVADGQMDSFLRPDHIHIFSANGYMLGVFPLGEGKYRLGGNMQLSHPRKLYTEKEIQDIVIERSFGKFNPHDITWISPFWIHSKIADHMRRGNVFLLGDAAHIHSPIGGQGMNTGLQDAHNLAWKLALVIQGRADAKLLNSYEEERYPVIKAVVKTTERFTKILLINNKWILFLRKNAMRLLFAIPSVVRAITQRMTQLDIRYVASSALDHSSSVTSSGSRVGERAPDVNLNHSHYFYAILNDTKHHLICFAGESDIFKTADFCSKLTTELLGPYKDVIKLHLVTPHVIDDSIDQIVDDSNAMHQLYKIKKPTLMVIRPDGYIAYQSNSLEISALKKFFAMYLQVT